MRKLGFGLSRMNLDYSVSGLKPTSIDILTNNSLMKKSFILQTC